ncbi:phosphotransferase [Actinoplanes sp. CA-142083]|uniref:phosphotransferase n=1 Tax=Actinoplanes sp. CA-142083 TaxID=3239903 RepID=UPI003D8EC82B
MAELSIVQPPETVFENVEVPAAVSAVAGGRPLRPVWKNALGGLTYEISGVDERFFVKFAPTGSGLPLRQEAERLAWASRYTPVPRVVDSGEDPSGFWMLTEALPGRSAVDAIWRKRPQKAVKAIAYGLRQLHENVPVAECPFDWGVEHRLKLSPRDLSHADEPHRSIPIDVAWARASDPPPIDKLVVCHGDACSPNTLLDDAGEWSGHVDMAALGAADRWADLAVASWALNWNYGTGWEPLFFATYGIEPDEDRIAYYRLLWDLGP